MKLETKFKKKFSEIFFSINFPFIKKTLRFFFQFYPTPSEFTYGIGSRCFDGQYVGFGDYDNLELEEVVEELKERQQFFDLGSIYIFQTEKNGFHFICLDKKSLRNWFNILKSTSADPSFIYSIKLFQNREWILRFAEKGEREKPKYVCGLIKKPKKNSIVSLAHKTFLKNYYGVNEFSSQLDDGITELSVIKYNTANRLK